jgi:hypothetical protein
MLIVKCRVLLWSVSTLACNAIAQSVNPGAIAGRVALVVAGSYLAKSPCVNFAAGLYLAMGRCGPWA